MQKYRRQPMLFIFERHVDHPHQLNDYFVKSTFLVSLIVIKETKQATAMIPR